MSTDGDDLDPRHIYVTQGGQFEYRRLAVPSPSALVIRFHAPLDLVLRRLDSAYLTEAWRAVESALTEHDVDPRGLSWGCGHPGEARGIGHGHLPRPLLETIGWIGTAATLGDFAFDDPNTLELLPRWTSIEDALETSDPPMCLMYDHYRAQRITRRGGEAIANDDGVTGLEIIRVDSTDSPVEWNELPRPEPAPLDDDERDTLLAQLRAEGAAQAWLLDMLQSEEIRNAQARRSHTVSEPEGAPWTTLRDAMAARDHIAVVDAMDAVRSEYSEHGARICLESAARWLMMRPTPDS